MYDEKKERVFVEDESLNRDNTEWRIILGAWRTSEFLHLLEKIHNRDFENLTIGEMWLVSDLLDSIYERRF